MRPTVLLVEDDTDLRMFYRTVLVMAGFDVEDASGGLAALRYLETTRPDAVVLDLLMPGINGFDVRSELRANARLRDVPIVVVTAIPRHDLQGFDAPCILTKPVLAMDLVRAVQRSLTAGPAAP
jgi:CheY-like chemotaxis protein